MRIFQQARDNFVCTFLADRTNGRA